LEITVLGCWAPYPRAGGACSGYLVQGGGVRLMVEAGNGAFSRLMQHIDHRSLDGVIITHLHRDHYLDLFPMRHAVEGAMRDGSRKRRLPLYLPSWPMEEYYQLKEYGEAFQVFSIEDLTRKITAGGYDVQVLKLGGLTITFAPTRHIIPSYAVSFLESAQFGKSGGAGMGFGKGKDTTDSKLVFSGDTAPAEELVALAAGADLFICEASGLEKDRKALTGIHCTAGQAATMARSANVKKLLLTHFWPEYDIAELKKEAGAIFGSGVDLVVEGKTYKVREW